MTRILREHLVKRRREAEPHFYWRGGEVSRIEGFSDAVFAFSVTLLVVSLEVPGSFGELVNSMRGFVAFALSFAVLVMIWHSHYIYFRRYGIEDFPAVILNAILLFVVLFYIYPLKFLFGYLVDLILGLDQGIAVASTISREDMPTLMIIYSLGYLTIFLVISILYLRAYHLRESLGLDEPERISTRASIQMYLIHVVTAIASLILAATRDPRLTVYAGLIYATLGITQTLNGVLMGRKLERAIAAASEPDAPVAEDGE